MKISHLTKTFALLSIAALAACGGSTGGTTSSMPRTPSSAPMFTTMVGVGDSLTAGEQSDGLLGVDTTNPLSAFPGNLVPAGQYNGYWSLLYQQATGASAATMSNPATSVLPLINPPGIGTQLVPTASGSITESHLVCDAFNQSTFTAAGFTSVRANPAAKVLDVAVPGITAHEAVNMLNPTTGPESPNGSTCAYPSSSDPTAALQPVVASESSNFIPVLGQYLSSTQAQKLTNGQPSTMVNAAAMLHPTFATVWLGANDLLHYGFAGAAGPETGVDQSQSQMQADITLAITTLQKAGAQGVAVGNLPNILELSQFFRGGMPPSPAACVTQNWLYCDVYAELAPKLGPANAQAATAGLISYLGATYGIDSNAYVTETGFTVILGTAAEGSFTPNLDAPSSAGSGAGNGSDYFNDALSAKIVTLTTEFNAAIAASTTSTRTALVDIYDVTNDLYNGNTGDPAVAEAFSINPAPNASTGAPFTCCSLPFLQGLQSYDGLHPSNTGYALIANIWIAAIDAKYPNANIAPLSLSKLQSIYATDPYAPHP